MEETEGRVGKTVVLTETLSGQYEVEARTLTSTFRVDEPVAAGGLGSGPDPFDLLCAALGACASMTIRLYAQRNLWPLHRIAIRVGHYRSSPDGADHFIRTIALEGDLDAQQSQRLLDIADLSPVHVAVSRGAHVRSRLGAITSPEDDRRRIEIEHMVALEQALRAS